uniref:Uncharacterized protein n=1 Tax=Rhizophora mucronata TaxID=61149 RepID=A0A2P2QRD6_RHIMU
MAKLDRNPFQAKNRKQTNPISTSKLNHHQSHNAPKSNG